MICSHKGVPKLTEEEVQAELAIKGAHLLGPSVESKFDELKYDIITKIDKELTESKNARDFIMQKFDQLSNKIKLISDLNSVVAGFRTDVKLVEHQIAELTMRIDDTEKRAICKECPSLTSSMF